MILSSKNNKGADQTAGRAGWSAPLLFSTPRTQRQVFSRRGPYVVNSHALPTVPVYKKNIIASFETTVVIIEKNKQIFLFNKTNLFI